jgi:hypothetical protein
LNHPDIDTDFLIVLFNPHPINTVGAPVTMDPPWTDISPSLAAGILSIKTVILPNTIESGGPTQTSISPTLAAGSEQIRTVISPGGIMGPPTCGITPVTIGQTCISLILAAGIPILYLLLVAVLKN